MFLPYQMMKASIGNHDEEQMSFPNHLTFLHCHCRHADAAAAAAAAAKIGPMRKIQSKKETLNTHLLFLFRLD